MMSLTKETSIRLNISNLGRFNPAMNELRVKKLPDKTGGGAIIRPCCYYTVRKFFYQ